MSFLRLFKVSCYLFTYVLINGAMCKSSSKTSEMVDPVKDEAADSTNEKKSVAEEPAEIDNVDPEMNSDSDPTANDPENVGEDPAPLIEDEVEPSDALEPMPNDGDLPPTDNLDEIDPNDVESEPAEQIDQDEY